MKLTRSEADMVSNILGTWDVATPVQREAGARWYAEAGILAALIADATGIPKARVVHAIAALSPRNPWRWNVFDAYAFCVARAEGRTMPSASTFGRNRDAAWRALDPAIDDPWLTSALKVRAFVAAIMGDDVAVVVDAWAARVATGQTSNGKGFSISDRQYVAIAHAYVTAANLRNVPPVTMQATTWLVAQSSGLASSRTSRHDLSYKAGTPVWLRDALGGTKPDLT